MPELTDIANEFIRQEIDEFIERPDERERLIAPLRRGASRRCRTSPPRSSTATTRPSTV